MLINVDKLWKPASQPPTESGFYYCIISVRGVPAIGRRELFYDVQITPNWIGLYSEQQVLYWVHIPSPQNDHLLTIPSEVILEEDELGIVVVKPPKGEKGVDIAVLVEVRDYKSAILSRFRSNLKVWLRPYDSDQDVDLDVATASFLKAKEQMDKEEELYKDE